MKAKKINRIKQIFISFVSLALVLFSALFSPFAMRAVTFAEEEKDIVAEYEATNVWDNLQGSTIGGNDFTPADYPHAEKDKPRIISLVEFCYSLYTDNQDDYGLYVYLYNPQDLVIDTETERNQIQMKCGSGNSDKYNLQFLNYSKKAGYEGRFWKFKVNLSETKKRNILQSLDPNGRTYEISEITLSVKKVATAYPCGQKYTYTGYVKGYGSELAEGDTLSCGVDGFDKYVELSVKQTCYRPIGDYYNGVQAQLNSCYFRVPEKYFTDYGELSEIVCEWWEYLTKPILVTESTYLYQQLYELHGASVANFDPSMYFFLMMYGVVDTESWFNKRGELIAYSSNYQGSWDDNYSVWEGLKNTHFDTAGEFLRDPKRIIDNFAAVFYTGSGVSYQDRYISSEELRDQLLLNSEALGESDITERFGSSLFAQTVAGGHTRGYNRKTISKNDKQDIFWNRTTKSTWQEIFGGYDVETKYDSVNAIVEVGADDLKGSDAEIAARLYVNQSDVPALKDEYNNCNNERLVLFRYAASEYQSYYASEVTCSADTEEADDALMEGTLLKVRNKEFNSYVAQETVYLDFDIISLWFTAEDGAKTEIPVVMSPQDVISGIDPPLDMNFHNDGLKWWQLLLILIGVVLLVVVLLKTGALQYIVKGIVWLVCLPFKAIGKLFKRKKTESRGKPNVKKRSGNSGKKKQYKQSLRSGGTAKPKVKSKGAGRQ